MQIEESAKDIVKRVGELGTHLRIYEDLHQKLGNALTTTVNHFNKSNNEFKKIDKDVMRITGEAISIETLTIEKPQLEE
jgi:DNA recombination protein RmuC